MASNSKLKENLQFIYELFVKGRTNNSLSYSSKVMLPVVCVSGSRFSNSEKSIHCDRRNFNRDNDDSNETFIREKDLMRKSDTNSTDDRREQKEIVGSL